MADIQISIPNNQVARVITALCALGGYTGDPTDQVARREFARSVIRSFVRQQVLAYEREQAAAEVLASLVIDPVTVD